MLFGGLALTALVIALVAGTSAARDRQVFQANARSAQAAITDRVETSIALLRGAAGLFASQGVTVTVASFRAYMDRVALREQYPGLLGIGFTRRFAPRERPALEAQMRAQGHAGFRVWPEGERPELHAIVFLEPLDERNRAAIGYDMSTQPVRRRAMERARDSGVAAASGIVELVQEIDERKQPGFLIYLPVYRAGAAPDTIAERRRELFGFAYAPIRAVDFLSSAFPRQSMPLVSFSVFHGLEVDEARLLYRHAPEAAAGDPRFVLRSTTLVAGEPWTFEFHSSARAADAAAMPVAIGLAGVILSALLAMLLWREADARRAIQGALEREQAARSQAERAGRMKDQFLATLSHELRTPLNAIVGWAALLRRGGLSTEEARAGLATMERNAHAQARLIDDLLDMNRIAAGKLVMERVPVRLASVLDDALASVAAAAAGKGLRVEKSIDAPLTVHGDAARLQQIAWNLLENAVKFTPAGGTVRVALERAADRARLTVADTGEGIDPALLGQIFDRFAQADGSTTRRHGGLGLGLAIVRELVSLHGGTVRAESEGPGRGARFTVELPLADMPPPAAAASAAPEITLDGTKVLLVDDEPDARELVRVILEGRKAHVRCAASAQEALEALDAFRPDVLLSDIGMPGMNGYDLLRALRRRGGPALPAIALTAYAREEDRSEALRAGYQAHIAKPVRPEVLLAAVAAAARGAARL